MDIRLLGAITIALLLSACTTSNVTKSHAPLRTVQTPETETQTDTEATKTIAYRILSIEQMKEKIATLSCWGMQEEILAYRAYSNLKKLSEEEMAPMLLLQTEGFVTRCGLNPTTKAEIQIGQMRGIVSALGDPHSRFLDVEETREYNSDSSGSFSGIGVSLEAVMNNGKFFGARVVTPIQGMPAERAGLKARDHIIAIGEKKAPSYKNLTQFSRDLRGQSGSKVTLTVFREGEKKLLSFTIQRAVVVEKLLTTEFLPTSNWVSMQITEFHNILLCNKMEQEYKELEKAHEIKGLVLDLRNNPGGFIRLAECTVSLFAPLDLKGKPMLALETRDGVTTVSRFESKNILKGKPLVVLVNGGSASASEIVAKTCQTFRFCVVVGSGPTYGKGSVQGVHSIGSGNMTLVITIAQYLVYNKSEELFPVQNIGVEPNIRLRLSEEERTKAASPQFREADYAGALATSTEGKNSPLVDTKKADPELYRTIADVLKKQPFELELE